MAGPDLSDVVRTQGSDGLARLIDEARARAAAGVPEPEPPPDLQPARPQPGPGNGALVATRPTSWTRPDGTPDVSEPEPGPEAGPDQYKIAQGLFTLRMLVRRAKDAEPDGRLGLLLAMTGNDAQMEAVAQAYQFRRDDTDAYLTELWGIKGLAKHRARVMGRLRKQAQKSGLKLIDFRNGQPILSKADLISILETVLEGHSLPAGLYTPEGWEIGPGGVARLRQDERGNVEYQSVTDSPVLITGRLQSISDDKTSLLVEWHRRGEWRQKIFPRHHLMTRRNVELLSEFDIPVTSVNSATMVQYFADYESVNQVNLPHARVSSKMGMLGNDDDACFLWGTRVISEGGLVGEGFDLTEVPPAEWREEWVHLQPEEGMHQISGGFVERGTADAWMEAARIASKYPKVMVGIYCSLVPPLLAVCTDAPNFCVDWAGHTSLGKTTTLRLAASCWGCPDERKPGPMGTWDTTRVGVERLAHMLGTMPLILDDTKKARRQEDLGSLVYDIASGHGRVRGAASGGLRETSLYRTVLLSSGESPLNRYSKDGGARARILQAWGSPFDRSDAQDDVARILAVINANYGHMGPRLVQMLLNNKPLWPTIRAAYQRHVDSFVDLAAGNPVAGRLSTYMGMVKLASELATEWLGLPLPMSEGSGSPVDTLYLTACQEAREGDLAGDALADVVSHCSQWQNNFYGQFRSRFDNGSYAPPGGWMGIWDQGNGDLYLLTAKLKEILVRLNYEPTGIIRQWGDIGWLVSEADKDARGAVVTRHSVLRKIRGNNVRVYGIKKEAVNAVLGISALQSDLGIRGPDRSGGD